MRDRRHLPSPKSGRLWGLGLLLALVLALLGAQVDHFWPQTPVWIRSLVSFGAVIVAGELWVRRYWPSMRRQPDGDVLEVAAGVLTLAVILSATLGLLHTRYDLIVPSAPVAWSTYMCYLLLDASYQW